MVAEKSLSRWLTGKLRERLAHVQRIEDALTPGIPDLNFCYQGREAWVELKTAEWPVRESTKVKPGLTWVQAGWLKARREAGGAAYLLVQFGSELLLFDGGEAHEFLDPGLTQEATRAMAMATGRREILEMLICANM